MPTVFAQLRDLFQLGCILRSQLFCMFPDGFIQNFLVAAVRAANSLSRSDSSRVWTFYQISLQDFIPYGILDRKKTGKSNF